MGESHILEQTKAMLKASPMEDAEEWAIHDYEGFEGASLSEYASFETVAALAEFIEEHAALGGELVSYYGGNLEDAQTRMAEYLGEYESIEDYARQYTEDCGTQIPESLENYIDYAAMGRDMEINGGFISIETANGEIHIFGGA
jgi:antirestriction protein